MRSLAREARFEKGPGVQRANPGLLLWRQDVLEKLHHRLHVPAELGDLLSQRGYLRGQSRAEGSGQTAGL